MIEPESTFGIESQAELQIQAKLLPTLLLQM